MKKIRFLIFVPVLALTIFSAKAGVVVNNPEGFVFKDQIVLPVTPVKNQYRSGTCWSFGGLALLEAEMLRLKKTETDLSEMFIVHRAYSEKAVKYVRLHGSLNFSGGGSFHDVTNMIGTYGIVPEEVYSGLNYEQEKHVHDELDQLLKNQVEAIVNNGNRKLTPIWRQAFDGTLNAYLGKIPEKFDYKGNTYTPQSFAREYLGLNINDYVEISSYSHHPFYSRFILEVPDNWSWDAVYNVPLTDFEAIIDNSLKNGYTLAWATDISDKGFVTSEKGVAMVPVIKTEDMTKADILRWEKLNDREKEQEIYQINHPVTEMEITQELRQLEFDNYQTTDDHGMLIFGMATDQNGKVYYKVKNSWGDYNMFNGVFYASKAYVNFKTTSIMVHKDAIPQDIRKKLGL